MMQFRFKAVALIIVTILSASMSALAGDTLRVLFIGNSYIYVNNLPQLISGMATAAGNHLITSSNAIGGYTLEQHSTDATTLSLIAQGNWDYVVLQEQSQRPSFHDGQVATQVYPYARKLDSIIKATNTCAKTVLYMTWGRKNGDASNCAVWPPVCTYRGMDSLLQLRYTIMADANNAVLTPVAKVWRRLRVNNPSIELYDADESHPSIKGSFAAACAFYAVLFKKDPSTVNYNAGITAADAGIIKNAAKLVVYDSLAHWYASYPSVKADFSYTVNGSTVTFINQSDNSTGYEWLYGNGNTATVPNPVYNYPATGTYTVKLIAKKCRDRDTISKQVSVLTLGIEEYARDLAVSISPNPAYDQVKITSNAVINKVVGYDDMGRLVFENNEVGAKTLTCDLRKLSHGSYFMIVTTSGGVKGLRLQLQ